MMFSSMRWRRYRGWLALVIICLAVLGVVFGESRITALTSSERSSTASDVTTDIHGLVDLFDDSIVHEIEVTFDPAEYQHLIRTYQDEAEKEFIEASVTIDGTVMSSVGLRLKGNSTLTGLRANGERGGQRRALPDWEAMASCLGIGDTAATPTTDEAATPVPTDISAAAPEPADSGLPGANDPDPGTAENADQAERPGRIGPGMGSNVSADDPSGLPWLIRFDEIVDGQRYQGLREIAIRPTQGSEVMLNEALAQRLVGIAGEPTELAAYTSFVVNGSSPDLRLILEVPGDNYAARNFEHAGVLYKANASGQFAYLGDDPTLYEDAFDQDTRRNQQDLAPLIAFLKWESEATNEEFAAGLADYLEVESFARYIALQELLSNFDDMAGPGNNYYLWYDLETERFTVLVWDLNLALSGSGGFGGGGGMVGRRGGAGQEGMAGMPAVDMEDIARCMPQGTEIEGPGGEGNIVVAGVNDTAVRDGQNQVRGGGRRGGNALKERFLATPDFHPLYLNAYAEVYEALYGANGSAHTDLERLTSVVAASTLVEAATLEAEAATLSATLDELSAAGAVPSNLPDAGTPAPSSPTP